MNISDFYLILNLIGTCTLVYFAAKVVKVFVQLWRESLWSETFDFKKLGNWAVITGGSDGIGKSVALELAKRGLNIVIIARTRSKLKKFAKEISENHSVEVRIIPIDVTSEDYIFDVIKDKTEGLDIAVLVNNVAVARSEPTEFLKVPNYDKYSINCVRANVNTMVKLTELFLPDMVKKKRGKIVNMSSLLGSTDSPYFAMYGATKKLIITYTKAMSEEYKKDGIIFQCITPAATETPLTSGVVKSNFMVPTGDEYGKYVVKAMGKSLYTNTGFWGHVLSQQMAWLTPTFVFAKVMKKGAENVERKKQSH